MYAATSGSARAQPAVSSLPPSSAVPRATIASDLTISRVIKGCWQLSGGHRGERETDRTAGAAAVEDFDAFVSAGITTLDTADHYGPAEALIGRYLQTHPQAAPPNTQVLSKYCVFSGLDMATINTGAVEKAVDVSLTRLRLASVPVMQFYWGDYDVRRYVDGLKCLAEVQAKGKVQHLGVTNFDTQRMDDFAAAGLSIATNQLQYSLLDTRPENGMAAHCTARNIALLPYGVLAGGFLSDKYLGVTADSVKLDTYSKGKYARVISARGGWDWFQRLLQACHTVGTRHGVGVSAVAARWVLDKPGVGGVILGARNATHIQDQLSIFNFQLDEADRGMIQEVLDEGVRPRGDCYSWERGGVW